MEGSPSLCTRGQSLLWVEIGWELVPPHLLWAGGALGRYVRAGPMYSMPQAPVFDPEFAHPAPHCGLRPQHQATVIFAPTPGV